MTFTLREMLLFVALLCSICAAAWSANRLHAIKDQLAKETEDLIELNDTWGLKYSDGGWRRVYVTEWESRRNDLDGWKK